MNYYRVKRRVGFVPCSDVSSQCWKLFANLYSWQGGCLSRCDLGVCNFATMLSNWLSILKLAKQHDLILGKIFFIDVVIYSSQEFCEYFWTTDSQPFCRTQQSAFLKRSLVRSARLECIRHAQNFNNAFALFTYNTSQNFNQ